MLRKFILALCALALLTSVADAGRAGRPLQSFGVNVNGAEFSPGSGQAFPTVANWDALSKAGVTRVRLPIAWESLQPVLGAALDPTYLASIKTALTRAAARGIGVIVDLHNFGAYCAQAQWTTSTGSPPCSYAGNAGNVGTGVTYIGGAGGPTTANFVDFWTRTATALLGTPGLAARGVMNEPHDSGPGATNLIFAPNGFGNSVSAKPWVLSNGGTVTVQAAGTNPLGSTYGPAWNLNSPVTVQGGVLQGVTLTAVAHSLSCYAKVASGSATLLLLVDLVGGGGSHSLPVAVTTTWQQLKFENFTPSAGANFVLVAEGAGLAKDILIANCQLNIGTTATAYVPNPMLVYYQAAINAIRAIPGGAAIPIHIDGLSGSTPYQWGWTNWDLIQLTGGNIVFNAHMYACTTQAQGGGGGDACIQDFSAYTGLTVTSAVDFSTPFVNWLTATGATGFFGEWGVPKTCCVASPTDSNASWLTLMQNFVTYSVANNVGGTGWFYSAVQPSDNLNLANGDARLPAALAIGRGH